MKSEILQTNDEFRICFTGMGRDNVAVAAARVCEWPSRRCKKSVIWVDVYTTSAKLIIRQCRGAESWEKIH